MPCRREAATSDPIGRCSKCGLVLTRGDEAEENTARDGSNYKCANGKLEGCLIRKQAKEAQALNAPRGVSTRRAGPPPA